MEDAHGSIEAFLHLDLGTSQMEEVCRGTKLVDGAVEADGGVVGYGAGVSDREDGTQVEALGSVQLGPFTDTWGIEAQIGLRYHHHDLDLALTDPVLVGNFGTSWIEPVVGLRYHSSIGSKVWFTILSNGAGFGLGSEFTWVLDGEVGYRLADNLDLSMRYRYLETNYRNSSTGREQYDWRKGQVQGWLFGVAYKW